MLYSTHRPLSKARRIVLLLTLVNVAEGFRFGRAGGGYLHSIECKSRRKCCSLPIPKAVNRGFGPLGFKQKHRTMLPMPPALLCQQNDSGAAKKGGSVLGAASLIAGTTIGGGFLGLPYFTRHLGFVQSSLLLLACWSLLVGQVLIRCNNPMNIVLVDCTGVTTLEGECAFCRVS